MTNNSLFFYHGINRKFGETIKNTGGGMCVAQ